MNRDRDLERARAEAAELCEQAATLAERVRRLALTLTEEAGDEAGGEPRPKPKLRLIRGGLAAVLGLILAWRWLRRAISAHPAAAAAAAIAVAGATAAVLTVIPSVSAGGGPPHRAPGVAKAHQRKSPARASRRARGSGSPQPGTSQPGPAPSQHSSTLPLPLPTSSLPVPLPSTSLPLPTPTPSPTCPGIIVLGKCLPL